jgi:hypothetical protein
VRHYAAKDAVALSDPSERLRPSRIVPRPITGPSAEHSSCPQADPQPDICIGAGCPHAAPAALSRLALEALRSVLAGRTEVSFAAGLALGRPTTTRSCCKRRSSWRTELIGLPGEGESEGLAELVAEL